MRHPWRGGRRDSHFRGERIKESEDEEGDKEFGWAEEFEKEVEVKEIEKAKAEVDMTE